MRPRFRSVAGGAAIVATTLGIHSVPADAQQAVGSFERWARTNAVPIQTVEPGAGVADLQPLGPMIGTARVVALGEPTHGAHEPLAFRNRLFQYLVEELGFTAIALESGFPESRRISDFVAGGPGTAAQVASESLTWGFGGFRENEQLILWIRDYNANPAHRRKVRFYGMDLSLGGPSGSTPTPAAVEAALSYLDRVDSTNARRMRMILQPWLNRLPGGAALSPAEHDGLTAAIDDLIALLERERLGYALAAPEPDYTWAHRSAIVARQADRLFRVLPPEVPGGGIPPAAWKSVNLRDAAMAENVLWALAREGPEGRILVFAHNAHVMNARIDGGIWSAFERPPNSMGQFLRSALGEDLFVIGTSSEENGAGLPPATSDSGGVDAALARAGPPRYLLDLRAARSDPAITAWLAERRALRANFTTFLTLSPGTAFDAFLFVDSLTPAHPAPPPQ